MPRWSLSPVNLISSGYLEPLVVDQMGQHLLGMPSKKKTPYGGTLSQQEGGGGKKLQNVPT